MSSFMSGLWLSIASSAPKAGSSASASAWETLIRFFDEGGPFMFVNIFWLACSLAVIAERMFTLMFRYNLSAGAFMEQIKKLVETGNVERAERLCAAAREAPLAKVVLAGLRRAKDGEVELAKGLEEAILEHTPPIQARVGWLWSLANIATLVGLVGTILGLINTFKSLGNVPAEQKQQLLSAGISEAMNNTAFGLLIAVTCIIFHLFLTAYSKTMLEAVELHAMKLENLLNRKAAGPGGTAPERAA